MLKKKLISWSMFSLLISSVALAGAQQKPGQTPEQQAPGQQSGEQKPVEQKPGKTPEQQSPGQQTPGQQAPGQQAPGQQTGQQTPGQQTPGQQTPGQQTPGQQSPEQKVYSYPQYGVQLGILMHESRPNVYIYRLTHRFGTLARLGLHNGDIIHMLGQQRMTSPAHVEQMMRYLEWQRQYYGQPLYVPLQIARGGQWYTWHAYFN
jgi:hypothetical protein